MDSVPRLLFGKEEGGFVIFPATADHPDFVTFPGKMFGQIGQMLTRGCRVRPVVAVEEKNFQGKRIGGSANVRMCESAKVV